MGIGRDGSWATHKSFRILQATGSIGWAGVGSLGRLRVWTRYQGF